MVFDHYNTTFHRMRAYLSVIVTPIQYVVSAPINFASWFISDMASQQSLIELNTNLKTEIIFLKAQLQKQIAIENENQQLRQLLQSSNQRSDWVSEAQLLAVAPDPFVHQIVIDKGSNANVFVGQPVLDAYGVMGQVVQVGPLTSSVLLLTDPSSGIPVQVQRNGVRAIAVGDPSTSLLSLQHVDDTADIQPGDTIITSGLGGRYPFGYPVGNIVSVQHSPGNQFATVLAEPAAHLNRSRLVLLVWAPKVIISTPIKKTISTKQKLTASPKGGAQ